MSLDHSVWKSQIKSHFTTLIFKKKERFSSLITFFGAKIQMKLKEMRLFCDF